MKKITITQYGMLLIILLNILGCTNNLTTSGNYLFNKQIEAIKPGLSKQEMIDLLGPYSVMSSFNENIVYYIYEVSSRKLKFLDKNIDDAKVIIITFNDQNIITKVDILDSQDRRKIPIDEQNTINSAIKAKPRSKIFQAIDNF